MNTYIFTMLLLVASMTSATAQRMIKGQKGFEASIGLNSDKKPSHQYVYVQAGLTVNGRNGSYQLWAFEYARKKHEFESFAIPVETYTVEGGYSFVLLGDWGKHISLNFGLIGLAGYEVINKSENLLPNGAVIQNKDGFIYGGALRLTLEAYLTDHILMLVQSKAKAVWGTSLEKVRPSLGVGIRYIF